MFSNIGSRESGLTSRFTFCRDGLGGTDSFYTNMQRVGDTIRILPPAKYFGVASSSNWSYSICHPKTCIPRTKGPSKNILSTCLSRIISSPWGRTNIVEYRFVVKLSYQTKMHIENWPRIHGLGKPKGLNKDIGHNHCRPSPLDINGLD